ncbi:MAG TPA: hypothetical protein VMH89_09580, partial [Candidatus Acidoferrum sp.]|nr:hypothetical protein [Candidatus Acidoferrum sp.]
MEYRKAEEPRALDACAKSFAICCLLFSILLLSSCGAPGEPTPPSPPVPTAVTDLSVRQSGDGALLSLTLPTRTVTNERLTEPPSVEIFRGSLKSDGKPDNKSFQLVYTLPGALLDTYTTEKHIQFKDPIDPH